MSLFLATLAIFLLVILLMALGVLMGHRHLQGSCGGPHGCDFCLFKHSSHCQHPRKPPPPKHP